MINNKKLHGAQNSIYSHLIKKKNPSRITENNYLHKIRKFNLQYTIAGCVV